MPIARPAASVSLDGFELRVLHLPLVGRCPTPCLSTAHGRLDLPDLEPLFRRFPEQPMVSISDSQRAPLPWLNWRRTVHHGLPQTLLDVGDGSGGYLAFLGRISPEKRPDRAVEKAVRGMLPKTSLARTQMGKLKVYAGPEHPHAAQQPKPFDITQVAQ